MERDFKKYQHRRGYIYQLCRRDLGGLTGGYSVKSYKVAFPTPTRPLWNLGSVKGFCKSTTQARVGGRKF